MKCTACGGENVEGAKYCAFCGKKLASRDAMTSAPPDGALPEDSAHAEVPEDERQQRVYARPFPENPIQPRKMPHIQPREIGASRDDPRSSQARPSPRSGPVRTSPLRTDPQPERALAMPDERPDAEDAARRVPARPLIRPDPKKMFLFEDELEEERAPRAPRRAEPSGKAQGRDGKRRSAYDPEDEEDIERKSRTVIRFFAVLTILVLIATTLLFATYSGAGRRLRTQLGWGVTAQDYLYLADWQLQHGNGEDAAASYYRAFLADNADFDNCLLAAAGFDSAGNYARAEQVYVYMTKNWPERDEPYDRLLALFSKQGKTQEYDALLNYRSRAQGGGATQTPVPAAPTASLPGGEYITKIQLQLTAEEGADIRYTLDGSAPSESSLLYTGPFSITAGKYTIRAVAIKNGVVSREWTATYAINSSD